QGESSTAAARPTGAGGRGGALGLRAAGGLGGCACCGVPKPKKSRGAWLGCCGAWAGDVAPGVVSRLGRCEAAGAPAAGSPGAVPGVVVAMGVSGFDCSFGGALACSRPISRRGQT